MPSLIDPKAHRRHEKENAPLFLSGASCPRSLCLLLYREHGRHLWVFSLSQKLFQESTCAIYFNSHSFLKWGPAIIIQARWSHRPKSLNCIEAGMNLGCTGLGRHVVPWQTVPQQRKACLFCIDRLTYHQQQSKLLLCSFFFFSLQRYNIQLVGQIWYESTTPVIPKFTGLTYIQN